MRIYSIFIIICLFQLLFCELCNKKKVEINENSVNSILTNFYPEIKEILKPKNLFSKSSFTIRDFSPEKVQVSIKNNGIVTLKIKDVTPIISTKVNKIGYLCVIGHASIYFENFEMEMNIKFNGNYTSDCQYSPNAELIGNPVIKFNAKVSGNYHTMIDRYKKMIENGSISETLVIRINQVFEKIKSAIIKNYNQKMK